MSKERSADVRSVLSFSNGGVLLDGGAVLLSPVRLHGVHQEGHGDLEVHVPVDCKKSFSVRGEVVEGLPVALELQVGELSEALHEKAML